MVKFGRGSNSLHVSTTVQEFFDHIFTDRKQVQAPTIFLIYPEASLSSLLLRFVSPDWIIAMNLVPFPSPPDQPHLLPSHSPRIFTNVTVVEGDSKGYGYRRGCETLVPSMIACKLPSSRRHLSLYKEISNAPVHLPKCAKLRFSQLHLSLFLYAFYGFMIASRTCFSKFRGTNLGVIELVDVNLFVGSTSWCYVTLDLEADSVVVSTALSSDPFTDFRSPMVIADSEDLLSLLNAKGVYIVRFLGVMYASFGFIYVSRLANIAAVDLVLVVLLSFLLNIYSSNGG